VSPVQIDNLNQLRLVIHHAGTVQLFSKKFLVSYLDQLKVYPRYRVVRRDGQGCDPALKKNVIDKANSRCSDPVDSTMPTGKYSQADGT
jgi:hypothetical protein